MHRAASDAVPYSTPLVARHTHSLADRSIGCKTNSFMSVAASDRWGDPRRETVPCQAMMCSSPSAAPGPASTNHDTLTAAVAACRTHPVGVRCCSTGTRSCAPRLSTRSGASSSSSAVTSRWTAFFSFALGDAVHRGATGLVRSSMCRSRGTVVGRSRRKPRTVPASGSESGTYHSKLLRTAPRSRLFLGRLEELQVFAVSFLRELRDRDEPHRRGVHAVTLAGRLRTVVEEVAEVRVRVRRPDFRTSHEQTAIDLRLDVLRRERLGEAWPSGSRLELVERAEQGLARHDVDIDAGFVIVPVLVLEWTLRRLVLGDLVLRRRQLLFELGLSRLLVSAHGMTSGRLRRRGLCRETTDGGSREEKCRRKNLKRARVLRCTPHGHLRRWHDRSSRIVSYKEYATARPIGFTWR